MPDHVYSAERARAVYAILVEECGAPTSQEDNFIKHFTAARYGGARGGPMPREWRFEGDLGGGKYWPGGHAMHVSCNVEHETPARLLMCARADARLTELFSRPDPDFQYGAEPRAVVPGREPDYDRNTKANA